MSIGRMRASMTILSVSLMGLTVAMLFWLGRQDRGELFVPAEPVRHSAGSIEGPGLSLGLIPERDIFSQRRRYRALADYLASELSMPVTLVTSNTYHGSLNDMAEGRIDAAFMGSMVATLAIDQLGARVLVKPELEGGVTTYRGVIFVRGDSPIISLEDLPGRTLAMVRTTTAGHLYPIYALSEHGLLSAEPGVVMRWVGTHDRVVGDVLAGEVDAGAAKDLRIDAYERAHNGVRFRRLEESEAVPNNALIVRGDMDAALSERLSAALLGMAGESRGREVLEAFGATRFVPCDAGEYRVVYEMAEKLGPGWGRIGVVDSMRMTEVSADDSSGDGPDPVQSVPGIAE